MAIGRTHEAPIGLTLEKLSEDELRELVPNFIGNMWSNGYVSPWYLKPKQRSVVDFVRVIEDPFFEASRRFGKTTSILIFVIEEALRQPIIVRWCEPWKNQCREIVQTEIDQIQGKIPKAQRFEWHQTDSYYEHKNGSRIYLRGVNEDRGESARGTKAHVIVCDELGSWREPTYVINEVLMPQLLTTKGKLVRTGTPPRNLVHVYYAMKEEAVTEKRFIQRLIHDQELVPLDVVERFVKAMGGWDSPAVRRELLCEKTSDPNFQIIPEWKDHYIQDIPTDEFQPYYQKLMGLDIGVRDNTVCLFGHYDFKRAAVIISDEYVINGPQMTTEVVAEGIRSKCLTQWGLKWDITREGASARYKMVQPNKHFWLRAVSDIDLLLVQDLSKIHGLYFEPTDKGSLEEMVNEVRIWVGAGRVLVHPRCQNTIDCLRYGLWDDDRKKWERSDRLGHFDALAALMYLIRNIDSRTNPIPSDFGKPHVDSWFNEEEKTKQRDKLKNLFNIR